MSPFELSLSDISGYLEADGVADNEGVEVDVTPMGEDFGNKHRNLSPW